MENFLNNKPDYPGGDSPNVILARVEQIVKNLDKNFEQHLNKYQTHVDQNDRDIRGLYKNQYIGYGVIITINFIIMFLKH